MKNAIYQLKVLIENDSDDEEIYRVLEINGSKSLEKLAALILESFNFDLDHAFGFYNNIQDIYGSTELYELFADLEKDPESPAKSVKKTSIDKVFEVGKEMLFFFDYGDEWMFLVHCQAIAEAEQGIKYPRIAETLGKAPDQYAYDDGDEEDEAITR